MANCWWELATASTRWRTLSQGSWKVLRGSADGWQGLSGRGHAPKFGRRIRDLELHQSLQTLDILIFDSPALLLYVARLAPKKLSSPYPMATPDRRGNQGPMTYLQPVGDFNVDPGDALHAVVEGMDCLGRLEVSLHANCAISHGTTLMGPGQRRRAARSRHASSDAPDQSFARGGLPASPGTPSPEVRPWRRTPEATSSLRSTNWEDVFGRSSREFVGYRVRAGNGWVQTMPGAADTRIFG